VWAEGTELLAHGHLASISCLQSLSTSKPATLRARTHLASLEVGSAARRRSWSSKRFESLLSISMRPARCAREGENGRPTAGQTKASSASPPTLSHLPHPSDVVPWSLAFT